MARQTRQQDLRHSKRRVAEGDPRAGTRRVSAVTLGVGCALLVVCLITSLMLALEHIGGLSLPGCGEGSACAEASASVWGKVPYVNWPVSFLGVAYFAGMLVVWLLSRRGIAAGVRYLVRVGVLASLGFTIIMIVEGHLCSYCLSTHLANLAFWIVIERSASVATGSVRALATVATVFVMASVLLGTTEWREQKAVAAAAEEDLAESTAAIIAATARQNDADDDVAEHTTSAQPVEPTEATTEPIAAAELDDPVTEPNEIAASTATEPNTGPSAATQPDPPSGGFTGRYLLGPKKAAIRVVMISDYQCKICKRIEEEVIENYERRDDMSVSFKHYPMGSDCNPKASSNRHPNACWAARAAETAGILGGNDAFWKMHFWLFDHGGSFTRAQLRAGLTELGYDVAEFERRMMSDETLELVKADVAEAIDLGIYQTPSVFINGVELRGWNAPKGVTRAITELAAANPPPMTAVNDQPPPALEKLIGDWQAERQQRILPRDPGRRLGADSPSVEIVIFGDYQHDGTAEADALAREFVAQRDDVRYEYRCFPFNKDCNPIVQKESKYPLACRAAYAAEAAARLGGARAFWDMHVWLFANQQGFSDETLREVATAIGLDADALLAEMQSPVVRDTVVEDAKLCRRLGSSSLPTIFIEGRRVPKWKLENRSILADIVAIAAED